MGREESVDLDEDTMAVVFDRDVVSDDSGGGHSRNWNLCEDVGVQGVHRLVYIDRYMNFILLPSKSLYGWTLCKPINRSTRRDLSSRVGCVDCD